MAKRVEAQAQLQEIAARPGVTVPWDRITVNRWKPDTCECVIEQWFDDAEPNPKTVLYAQTVTACSAHPTPDEAAWNTIGGENRRKNAVLEIVESVTAATREDIVWQFSTARITRGDERVLEISGPFNNPAKASISSAADVQFGPGAVVVL